MAGAHRKQSAIPFGLVLVFLVGLVVGATVWRAGGARTRTAGERSPRPSVAVSGSASPTVTASRRDRREREPEEPSPKPEETREPKYAPTGRLEVVPGRSPVSGSGTLQRYIVEVEEGLPIGGGDFAADVERALASPRGWGGTGKVAFQRVGSGTVSFRVTLASREKTDELCYPLLTNGIFSCFMRGRAVLNFWRWQSGSDVYPHDLRTYRVYMINHEVGHAIGHDHATCPGAGRKAPVMMQQSKGLYGCEANPWPLDWERGA